MLYPDGVREGLGVKMALAGTTDNANLTGTVNVRNSPLRLTST